MIAPLVSLLKDASITIGTAAVRAIVRLVTKKIDDPEEEKTSEAWTWQDVKRANDASHVPEAFKVKSSNTGIKKGNP